MPRPNECALASAYLCAKGDVLRSPFGRELVAFRRGTGGLSESEFLRELAWVILSSGMADSVVRRKFAAISTAFLEWASARRILEKSEECVREALRHFDHVGKIGAIVEGAAILYSRSPFCRFLDSVLRDPERELRVFPYIGPATARHLAKNIGVRAVKPDRHLRRLARVSGLGSVDDLCETIGCFLGEDVRLVDSVLWRFATMHRDYPARFSRFMV